MGWISLILRPWHLFLKVRFWAWIDLSGYTWFLDLVSYRELKALWWAPSVRLGWAPLAELFLQSVLCTGLLVLRFPFVSNLQQMLVQLRNWWGCEDSLCTLTDRRCNASLRFQRRNLVGFAAIGLVAGFWEWCVWLLLVLDMWCAWAAVHGGYLWMFELLLPWCDFYSTMTRIASWVLCGSVDKIYNCLSTIF